MVVEEKKYYNSCDIVQIIPLFVRFLNLPHEEKVWPVETLLQDDM